jgi:repressor LexA
MRDAVKKTSRERVLDFVRQRLLAGQPPTVREVQAELGFSAVQSAKQHLDALLSQGLIEQVPGARGYRLPQLPGTRPARHVPVIGRVQAGALSTAVEEPLGYVVIEGKGRTEDLFALKVRGPSMQGAGILHGDLVIVRRQPTAQNGDIVVALVDDEATIKTFHQRHGRIELHPANPDFDVIVLDAQAEPRLLGVVIEVRRIIIADAQGLDP